MSNRGYNLSRYDKYNYGVFKTCASFFFSLYRLFDKKYILFITIVWLNEICTS